MSRGRFKLLLFAIVAALLLAASVVRFVGSLTVPAATASHAMDESIGPAWAYPDRKITPGVASPDITEANLQETICNPNWSTKNIRPPSSYTSRLKREQMQEMHLPGSTRDYEEDHFIPLELGGDPTDPRNLWPEPYNLHPGAREKDIVENYLHKQVCSGAMTIKKAQHLIVTDWYRLYIQIEQNQHSVEQ